MTREVGVGDVVCPRCVWERSASGPDAPTLLAVVLRAHVEIWHPGAELEAAMMLDAGHPPARSIRPRRRHRTALLPVASAAG
jgi:hypothetical protein